MFAEYVGASPKWVIRPYQMQDAAAHAAAGKVAWARLAADLGYSDQAPDLGVGRRIRRRVEGEIPSGGG
jgi:hypothetical protein